jgi:hypothetical protein
MNKSPWSLINLKPKIAILDDDKEFVSDLISCVSEEINIIEFSSAEKLEAVVSCNYDLFLNALIAFLTLLKENTPCRNKLEKSFLKIIDSAPFSVALIDLNLENEHANEGFEVCELLLPYAIKTLIYSGSDFNQVSLSLINQCVISGQLNKSCDLFEDLMPAIFSLNKNFLDTHYNITHLASLRDISLKHLQNNFSKNNMKPTSRQFIVYDEFNNTLTK